MKNSDKETVMSVIKDDPRILESTENMRKFITEIEGALANPDKFSDHGSTSRFLLAIVCMYMLIIKKRYCE